MSTPLPASFLPKGLYIHVPFCASRCPYCDFYILVSRDEEMHLRFVQRLMAQLDAYIAQRPGLLCGLQTVFLGGGTPSLLGARALNLLLENLEQRLERCGHGGINQLQELSMESNPELIQRESLETWQGLGISRLSVGLQTGSDFILRRLGRRSSRESHERLARELSRHFRGQYSFDFMYGIPGQELADITDSLDFIERYQPHHVSYYELSIEEDTLFGQWQRQGRLPASSGVSSEINDRQFDHICKGLGQLGYKRYEISNFARCAKNGLGETGRPYISKHNEIYWQWQPYLGLGPSAVGASLQGGRVWRQQGPRGPEAWNHYMQDADFGVKCHSLNLRESLWEYLLMALRLRRGINAHDFARLFSPNPADRDKSPHKAAPVLLQNLLANYLPLSLQRYADFFSWSSAGDLMLTDCGFDLQDSFLRAAYKELHL